MSASPTILFLCPHNALRSVIAAALFNQRADGRARAESAGTEPDDRVNERTIAVLHEVGIEVANERPGRVTAGAERRRRRQARELADAGHQRQAGRGRSRGPRADRSSG